MPWSDDADSAWTLKDWSAPMNVTLEEGGTHRRVVFPTVACSHLAVTGESAELGSVAPRGEARGLHKGYGRL
jgi:hypothetical protein